MNKDISEAQLRELAEDLQELAISLDSLLTATEDGAKPVKLKDNAGRLSRMDEMHNQSILVANRNLTRNRLGQVRAAIQRAESGDFGYCRECDEVISFARLKAYPETTMCVSCQAASED